ncbi:MAG: hypothetical protein JSU96_04800 [Acidobacteriota bacterium]|nr:MAG: hypothetical protein JSU96_04800 [Acidobacteriota bacterium]
MKRYPIGLLLFFLTVLSLVLAAQSEEESNTDFATLRSAELTCTIGNNAALGEHLEGYNGVFELTSVHQGENLFVPAYAGLNLEHVFDGSARVNTDDVFFEPRRAPMEFDQIDARTAVLSQPSLPTWKVSSKTTFRLVNPNYIDVTVEVTPHTDSFEGGGFGLFWASYINGPLDKSIYFQRPGGDGEPVWQQFSTQLHNRDSTVTHKDDQFVWEFSPEARPALFSSISPLRYELPFFYGRFRNMVFILIFDQTEGIRFTQSPSGGGTSRKGDDTNPAWDFQWIHPDFEIGQTYRLNYRAVYKLWEGREDVLKEVRKFR